MEKNTKSKRFNFGKIIIALLLCLFCSLSFVGCTTSRVGVNIDNSDKNNPNDNQGGGEGSAGGSGSGGSGGSTGTPNINDFNTVFAGSIGVYQIDGSEDVYSRLLLSPKPEKEKDLLFEAGP